MKLLLQIISWLIISTVCRAQFPPQAGLAGSTAVHKDSSIIVEWAANCTVQRGWLDIADTTLGKTTQGDSSKSYGMADGDVVSLGDGGEAILYFENPISNGNGFDFAVFENGFRNPVDSNEAYLELASVEVSNDGIAYYNFATQSHTDTSSQVGGVGQYMDARKILNLAGKYITHYGTPFDLDELSMQFGLDVNNIHYLKVKDVVGTLDKAYCERDFYNNVINDPYPTPFPTGGFDLDAVGVIHHKFPTELSEFIKKTTFNLYPNPATHSLFIENISEVNRYKILSIDGQVHQVRKASNYFDISNLKSGFYVIEIIDHEGNKNVYRFVKK